MSTHRNPPKPPYFDTVPEGTCRWCNIEIGLTPKGKPSKSRWHPVCVTAYKLVAHPSFTRRSVWQRDKGKCRGCGTVCTKKGIDKWHMDHINPLINAHGDIAFWLPGNLQTLCIICHKIKTKQESQDRALIRKLAKSDNIENTHEIV